MLSLSEFELYCRWVPLAGVILALILTNYWREINFVREYWIHAPSKPLVCLGVGLVYLVLLRGLFV